ncbi:uncharacterized protein LOC128853109 isoform X2 [Cuculus canorus]|uniref:uncharacterized protein LOC128853109 isoform X2 n=1 Tax=Cuculus canorus TaxID=55661 RepID=UPI0023AB38AB|nr:uncharacterized protein LOC128853109 isoform X2 [Cuculus canorus]
MRTVLCLVPRRGPLSARCGTRWRSGLSWVPAGVSPGRLLFSSGSLRGRSRTIRLTGLLVSLQEAVGAPGVLRRKVTAVGSSVLLPGPDNITHIDSTRWEFLNGTSSNTILQYYRGSHKQAIHAPYTGRAIFHPSNGSLLLEDVQESDSGIYKVTVNVRNSGSMKILLEVLSKWWAWEGGAG